MRHPASQYNSEAADVVKLVPKSASPTRLFSQSRNLSLNRVMDTSIQKSKSTSPSKTLPTTKSLAPLLSSEPSSLQLAITVPVMTHHTKRPVSIPASPVVVPTNLKTNTSPRERTPTTLPPTGSPTHHPTLPPPGSPPTDYPTSSPTSSLVPPPPALPIVEFNDCKKLAPCHVLGDDTALTCAVFHAQRFWKAAPAQLQDDLRYQREHRPVNCWYETELLWINKLDNATNTPYKKGTCTGPSPDHLVYWHNFKAGGTTARQSLGVWISQLRAPS
jgi:hypothetical protein